MSRSPLRLPLRESIHATMAPWSPSVTITYLEGYGDAPPGAVSSATPLTAHWAWLGCALAARDTATTRATRCSRRMNMWISLGTFAAPFVEYRAATAQPIRWNPDPPRGVDPVIAGLLTLGTAERWVRRGPMRLRAFRDLDPRSAGLLPFGPRTAGFPPSRGSTVARGIGQGPGSEERRVGKECRSRWSPYH